MQRANVNGVEMEYEVTGSGEPVLLISVGPFADSFLPLLSENGLVERFRLISYRQRKLANGSGGATPVSFGEHAADAAGLLGHLGVRRAHVAGHSTGAAIALQLAVDRPDIVHTLTLLEPPLVGIPAAGVFFEKAGAAVAAYGSGDREGAMAAFLTLASSLDWRTCRKVIETQVPGGIADAMKNADNFFGSYLPALNAWQFGPEQAATISQPVLSVLGAHSDPWFVDGDAVLHAWFPQLEDCRIEGVAHLLHIQRPEPVARDLAQFFTRHPIAGWSSGAAVA